MRVLLALLLITWPLAAETYLVCAGVETYDDPGISPLKFAVADVTAFADAFRAAGVPAANITVLATNQSDRLKRPTRSVILRALQAAREKAVGDDTLLFFFAGHGMEQEGVPYLLTSDSLREELKETSLPIPLVQSVLKGFQARNVLFVIDACRNDPASGRAEADARLDDGFARGLRTKLTKVGPQTTAALLLACDVGQRAWEMPEAGHGAFTSYLLQGLAGAGRAADGSVTLSSLAGYVLKEVPAWAERARREQTPRYDNPSGGDFVLLAPPAQAELQPTQAVLEIRSTPPGAAVYLDGQDSGRKTNCEVTVELGVAREKTVEVGLQLAGHAAKVVTVRVQRGQRLPLALTLDPTGPAPARPTGADVKPAGWPVYLSSFTPPAGMTWSSFRVSPKDGMPQVLIPAGEFTMGTTPEQLQAALRIEGMKAEYAANEQPARKVHLSAYWMDRHEVTNAQYCRFLNDHQGAAPPGWFDPAGAESDAGAVEYVGSGIERQGAAHRPVAGRELHPVVWVSWDGAQAYARWAGRELPTEAQWEKAARGGHEGRMFVWGDGARPPHGAANLSDEAAKATIFSGYTDGFETTSPACTFSANGYGLYDMAGNVWEWCRDWYHETWYQQMPARDPLNNADGDERVFRGGSYWDAPCFLRVAIRGRGTPADRGPDLGFRCAERAGGLRPRLD